MTGAPASLTRSMPPCWAPNLDLSSPNTFEDSLDVKLQGVPHPCASLGRSPAARCHLMPGWDAGPCTVPGLQQHLLQPAQPPSDALSAAALAPCGPPSTASARCSAMPQEPEPLMLHACACGRHIHGSIPHTCSARPNENDSAQCCECCCAARLLMALRFTVASSSLRPPLRNMMPGTAGGTLLPECNPSYLCEPAGKCAMHAVRFCM